MKLFNKIGIIGIGLIGGSLGLAIRKYKLAQQIIGVSRSRTTLREALKRKVVDIADRDLNILEDVDMLILATPVETIRSIAPLLKGVIRKDCFITDVGSTKKEIVLKLERIFSYYVGSHPLTGSQNAGVRFANADLFKNSLCILTPTNKTSGLALSKIKRFWKALGAKTEILSPSLHDRILAYTSHLPHLVAFSLCEYLPSRFIRYTASGFRDTTRIALSTPSLWHDIFISNRKELIEVLRGFKNRLDFLENILSKSDSKSLLRFLKKAQTKRKKIL